jgi:hypothetical protein
VAQLAPDLARDASIRRRYVRDQERVAQLGSSAVLPTLELGPQPDPRNPEHTVAPWRMRPAPDARSMTELLARAPLPLDEFSMLFTGLADAIHDLHVRGAVLRDLRPEQVLRTADGSIVLSDIGLARVDVLSSHTASSLMLQGSPYAAPEQLYSTSVDQRSDLYSVGALMWHALTGALPFSDGPLLLRERPPLPPLQQLRADAPASLAALLPRLLASDPSSRPPSIREVAWVLRGGNALTLAEATVDCQHCGGTLHIGQRLCLHCGRVSVRHLHAPDGELGWGLNLRSLSEDATQLEWLQRFLGDVSQHPMRAPEFIIGNIHMYGEQERGGRIRLPARLYSNLQPDTAVALHDEMQAQGLKVELVSPSAVRRASVELGLGAAGMLTLFVAALMFDAWIWAPVLIATIATIGWLMSRVGNRIVERRALGQFRLRSAPAALPASDPFVARLAALFGGTRPADVQQVIGDIALLIQRLVDHRASLHEAQVAELEMVTQPVEALVGAVERAVAQLETLDAELGTLDEGAMVRALAASEARDDPPSARESVLLGLDRLRSLEDQRAAAMHRLLEAQALLHRSVALGLAVQDPHAQHERDVAHALATLQPG